VDQDPIHRDPLSEVQGELSKCNALLRVGKVGAALRLLDSIELPTEEDHQFLRIQMLHAADLPVLAYEEVRTLPRSADPNPDALLRLALVCADAGADIDAKEYLLEIVNEALQPSSFELAIAISRRIGSFDLAKRFEDSVLSTHPDSDQARQIRWYRALALGDFLGAATNVSPQNHQLREPLYELQKALIDTDPPDFEKSLAVCLGCPRGTDVPAAVTKYALSQGKALDAVRLAKTFVNDPGEREVGALLDVLDWLLLHRTLPSWTEMAEEAELLVLGVIGHLASRPERGGVRHRLIKLLSVERSSDYGLALIVSAVFRVSDIDIGIRDPPNVELIALDKLEQNGFLRQASDWLISRAPCVPGRTVLPRHIIRDSPDSVLATFSELVSSWDPPLTNEDEIQQFLHWVLLGAAVAPHASRANQDISLIRVAATQLANAGQSQHARNLCEQILLSSGDSADRAQAAWFAMSDIYSRAGDLVTSCVAFASALSSCSGKPVTTGWNELNSWVRLLRSARLFDWARQALELSNDALRSIGRYEAVKHQQDFLELSIDMKEVLDDPPGYEARMPPLLDRFCANGREVIEKGESPTQVLIALGQLVDIRAAVGISVPEAAIETLAALRHLSAQGNALAAAIGANDVTADMMFNLYRSMGGARYSDDAAHDSSKVATLARNFITLNAGKLPPGELVVPFEMCADGGIAAPGWTVNSHPPARLQAPQEFMEVAEHLRQHGIALVMGTFDNLGRLVTLRVSEGKVDFVEETGFHYTSFQGWAKSYPFDYGEDEEKRPIFSKREIMLRTLEGCQLAPFPNSATLVVLDSQLRSIPPNILLAHGELIGDHHPVGAAPSLTWLAASFRRQQAGAGCHCAWISNGGSGESLNMLVENLAPDFAKHGVHFDTGSQVPTGFAGADLAIVTAHGSVSPEGQYFHALNDEGTLKVPAEALANSLRNVRVVVLFVCSGGRSDKVPGANTTSGLAKQLLNAGCSTVIASPWPVQTTNALGWIPEFLERWSQGERAIDACFHVNQAIGGDDPCRKLAMNLFGDPCQRSI